MFGIPLALPTRKRVVTIQVSFLLRRLRRRGEGEGGPWKPPRLPCPAPRQGALQAPWNPLLNSYKRVTNKTTGKMLKMQRLPLSLALSSGIAMLAYRRRSLNRSGVAGTITTGTAILTMGGWSWGLSLIYFFISSSLLSHFREREKARTAADKFSKGSQRDILQVAANGGAATLMALTYGLTDDPLLRAGFTGSLATATADTWATELGVLSPHQPRLITTGKRVPAGTSGGITLLGTSAAFLGALSFGLVFWALQGFRKSLASLPLVALLSGLAGSFFDSLLGATVQAMYYCPSCDTETERRIHDCGTKTQLLRGVKWMNNDTVNFLATLFGGLVAMRIQRKKIQSTMR